LISEEFMHRVEKQFHVNILHTSVKHRRNEIK
jgi:hypothetical protein